MGNLESLVLGAAGLGLGLYSGAGAALTGIYTLLAAYLGNYVNIYRASKAH